MANRGEIPPRVRGRAKRRAAGVGLGFGILVASVSVFGDESVADRYFFAPSYETVSAERQLAAKVDPTRDGFQSEAIGERIALKFDELILELKQSPANTDSVAEMLADGFRAVGWGGREVAVRTAPPLLLYRRVDPPAEEIDRERFLAEFRSVTAAYRQIETAEFEIVGIVVHSDRNPARVETKVHFDIVGLAAGEELQRIQQTGDWVLDWSRTPQKQWLVHRWRAGKRTRAVASHRVFADVSEQALGVNDSYRGQLRHGVDHWRSQLDGRCYWR